MANIRTKKYSGFFHAFSTKEEGNMSFKWGEKEEVIKNREIFLLKFRIGIDSCVALNVEDSDTLVVVDEKFKGRGMRNIQDAVIADGFITRTRNLFLFLTIGDCLPIILFDQKQNIISLIHSGWKSTEAKIVMKAVNNLTNNFGCCVSDILVAIGPSIHKESFKFKNPIQKRLKGWAPFLEDLPDGTTSIDLISYNKSQLKDAGVMPQNIFISNIDTGKDSNFFSHYQDSKQMNSREGRFACVIGLR